MAPQGRTNLGAALVSYRLRRTLPVRDLAKVVGLSPATLSRIERGGAMDERSLLKVLNWLLARAEG